MFSIYINLVGKIIGYLLMYIRQSFIKINTKKWEKKFSLKKYIQIPAKSVWLCDKMVATRQNKNIRRWIMRHRWGEYAQDNTQTTNGHPAQSIDIFDGRSICGLRMEDGKTMHMSTNPRRQYNTTGHYICQPTLCVYVVTRGRQIHMEDHQDQSQSLWSTQWGKEERTFRTLYMPQNISNRLEIHYYWTTP